jgi:uncharacterized repeat protein (TIGR01451 family)
MDRIRYWFKVLVASLLCGTLPVQSWANITNIASVGYQDASGQSHTATSNTLTIATPPVITSSTTATGDVGVAFSYQITATNSPTSYNATGLPAGLSVNTASGLISGTPSAGGTSNVTLSATSAGVTGTATLVLTINPPANVTLTKTDGGVTTAVSGNVVTYAIQYQNTSSGAARNLAITDVIPTGTTFVSGSITGVSGVFNSTTNTITWTIGNVPGNGSGSVGFSVRVN